MSGRKTKIISRKLKYIFLKKASPHFLGHIGLQKKKGGVTAIFG